MALIVNAVQIRLFDLHISVLPLVGGVGVRPKFQFLLDSEAYAKVFESPPLESEGFSVYALRRDRKRNHFWRHHREIWLPTAESGERGTPWSLQVPFRCRPKGLSLDLDLAETSLRGQACAGVLLWPAGWSSIIDISLTGDVDLGGLREVMENITSRSPFVINNETNCSLSSLFKKLANRVKNDVYGQRHEIGEKRKVDRQTILAITSAPTVFPFYDSNEMPDADRAKFMSILLRKEVSLPQLIDIEKGGRFFRTTFRESDFGLTSLDHRSTVLSFTASAASGRSQKSLDCLTSNIRSCTIVTDYMRWFLAETEKFGANNQDLASLRGAAVHVLEDLPEYYDNPFCGRLFAHRNDLPGNWY